MWVYCSLLFLVDFKLSAMRKPIAITSQKSDKTQFLFWKASSMLNPKKRINTVKFVLRLILRMIHPDFLFTMLQDKKSTTLNL